MFHWSSGATILYSEALFELSCLRRRSISVLKFLIQKKVIGPLREVVGCRTLSRLKRTAAIRYPAVVDLLRLG